MWHGEVLDKFPVAQHILFGKHFNASWVLVSGVVCHLPTYYFEIVIINMTIAFEIFITMRYVIGVK